MPKNTYNVKEIRTENWWERYTMDRTSSVEHQLSLFFRFLTPPPGAHERRSHLVKKLETTQRQGVIDEYTTRVFGGELCLCTNCQGRGDAQEIHDTMTELASWNDGTLNSVGFVEREVDRPITGDQYRTLVPPETALAVYLDGDLRGVFPCVADGTHYSVETFISALVAESTDNKVSRKRQRIK